MDLKLSLTFMAENIEDDCIEHATENLLQIATAYQQSKALFTLVELRIPTLLAGKQLKVDEISEAVGVHPLALDRLLNACVALNLLRREDAGFTNTEIAEKFLIEGNENYLGDLFLNYNENSYPLWNKLTARLKDWTPNMNDAETPQAEDQGAEAMNSYHNFALMTGKALAHSFDFSPYKNLLDVGGGTAAMSLGICEFYTHLKATIFELDEIAQAARVRIKESSFEKRLQVVEGNFKEDSLPDGFDVALLANLLSVSSAKTNKQLLRRIYERLPSNGACILSGWILDDTRTSPLMPILFCMEDINWQVPDVERTESQYKSWLQEAGFVNIERKMYFAQTSFMVGYKQ